MIRIKFNRSKDIRSNSDVNSNRHIYMNKIQENAIYYVFIKRTPM